MRCYSTSSTRSPASSPATTTAKPDPATSAAPQPEPARTCTSNAAERCADNAAANNTHLQPVLVESAWAAVRHQGYLKALYHRHVMKWGGYRSPTAKKKAIIVVAHALIVIIWHVLATGRPYDELGADYFTTPPGPRTRNPPPDRQSSEALGHTGQPPARRLTTAPDQTRLR